MYVSSLCFSFLRQHRISTDEPPFANIYTVIIYVLIPVPWLFFSYQNDEDAECSDIVNQFGFCTSGMIFSSLFGLPFACYVSGKVDDDGVMTGWTIANLAILISITFIIYLVSKGDD